MELFQWDFNGFRTFFSGSTFSKIQDFQDFWQHLRIELMELFQWDYNGFRIFFQDQEYSIFSRIEDFQDFWQNLGIVSVGFWWIRDFSGRWLDIAQRFLSMAEGFLPWMDQKGSRLARAEVAIWILSGAGRRWRCWRRSIGPNVLRLRCCSNWTRTVRAGRRHFVPTSTATIFCCFSSLGIWRLNSVHFVRFQVNSANFFCQPNQICIIESEPWPTGTLWLRWMRVLMGHFSTGPQFNQKRMSS